jgi:phospholipase D-like protein
MSRHSSRFVANRELWGALREHVRKGTGVRAAVAYFGRNGAKLFPLKRGDTIVADLSIGAVRQGVTDPRELRTLMQRGVAIFSRPTLHAKFIIANHTVIASSANVSRNSRDSLDEAGIITTDPAAVRRAADFFEKLCTSPVSKRYLRKCIAEYRPPRFKAAVERAVSRGRSHRVPESNLWFVGGLQVVKETPLMQRLAKRAEKRLKTPEKNEVGWIHYHAKPQFLRGFRLGDWVVQCMKDGETRYVSPPAQLLSLVEGRLPDGKKYAAVMLETPSDGESMALGQFRRKIRAIEPSLDKPSPRTRPIQNTDHADRILRLWTPRGKIAK